MLGVILPAAVLAYIVAGLSLMMGAGTLDAALIVLLGGPALAMILASVKGWVTGQARVRTDRARRAHRTGSHLYKP